MKLISCTKLQLPPEPLTRELPPPDPRSLCPLSSTEFVEPHLPEKRTPGYATGQGWRPFLRGPAQTVYKFRRKPFACQWEF